jgi:hypothetical protein
MLTIIIGLITALILLVVAINIMQQHKEKLEAEKRVKIAKQKAIIDETDEIISTLTNLPSDPEIIEILNRRMLNAVTAKKQLVPDAKNINERIKELDSRLKASMDLALKQVASEQIFILPDKEQQLIEILQCIKKLRSILKSEQAKGILETPLFMKHDQRLAAMQLKINIETLLKRAKQAYEKEMLGSARQYFEKALQTLANHPITSEYIQTKQTEITEKLAGMIDSLKSTNDKYAKKKAKESSDDLDMLFQPKKKW